MVHLAAVVVAALLCGLWAVLHLAAGDGEEVRGGRCAGCRRDETCGDARATGAEDAGGARSQRPATPRIPN
jgi:hypothetical protein